MEENANQQRWVQIARSESDPIERLNQQFAFVEEVVVNAPQDALRWSGELLEKAQEIDYQAGIAYAKGLLGYAHYMLSEHDKAMPLLLQGLHLVKDTGDEAIEGRISAVIADVFISIGDFQKAVEYGYRALDLMRISGDRTQEAWVLHGFGIGFLEMDVPDRALACFEDSLKLFREVDVAVGIGRALTGIGSVYQFQGMYEKALPCHEESLALFRQAHHPISEARAYNDLGTVHLHLGNFEQAHRYLEESLRIRIETGNRQSQSTSLLNLGRVFLAEGNPESAIERLNRAQAIAEDVGARTRIYQIHEVLSQAYEQAGRYTEALKHHREYADMKAAVFGEKMTVRLSSLQSSFSVEQALREADIERLRNEELQEKNVQLERLLDELKTTQAQLIQSEKMASLGHLTAGIAHEIKNPLNFVNNFASLSIELMQEFDELIEQNRKQSLEQVLVMAGELLADLRFNTAKIHEHGQRADSIVRSMLQHAGGRDGPNQEVSINELLHEYAKLAYHGMRAQDNAFSVSLHEDFAGDLPTLQVAPHDLGRVILNILNNAFYAIRERSASSADPDYRPQVSISTRLQQKELEIRISDNGPGIQDDVLKHIFNPFFTTKPTGDGTGLGLSLSYDIITQGHSGRLEVESQVGKGTTFIIYLPYQAR